ncbi:hypothetical protein Pelo_19191 [Pelomyxa schiedti]|nr:hypothetical protein Pelo_19191 [Pelomyxa schiedti]
MLHFFRRYPVEEEAALFWHVAPDTYRIHLWELISFAYDNFNEIHFEDRFEQQPIGGLFPNCLWAVDGTAIAISRPKNYAMQRMLYSGKKKRHNDIYIVRISDGLIVQCPKFGFPGCCGDITA